MNEATETKQSRGRLGWVVIGAILGAAITLVVVVLRGNPAPASNEAVIRAVVKQELNAIDFKSLARQGVLEAIREDQQRAEADAVTADSGNTVIGPQLPKLTAQPQISGVQVPLGNNILGDKNAPVVMIEYSDFQ